MQLIHIEHPYKGMNEKQIVCTTNLIHTLFNKDISNANNSPLEKHESSRVHKPIQSNPHMFPMTTLKSFQCQILHLDFS